MSERIARKSLIDSVCVTNVAVDLKDSCRVLRGWNGAASTDARGANLWDQFWRRISALPDAQLYAVPFDAKRPLDTPAGLMPNAKEVAKALASAAETLKQNGFALDSTRGDVLYARDNDGAKIPLYGGCDSEGYFTVACPLHELNKQGLLLDRDAHGNSYMQVVAFDDEGPQADTLLAHSESDDPVSPHYRDGTRRYAQQAWSRFPFTARALEASPGKSVTMLEAPR
jgi:acyl-homoserine-lactone acylase